MPAPHEIADERLIFRDFLSPLAIADPRRLDDSGITAHIVDQPDKPVVQDLELLVQPAEAGVSFFVLHVSQIITLLHTM